MWWFSSDDAQPFPGASVLSPGEQEAANRFHKSQDANRFRNRRTALRHILSQYVPGHSQDLQFDTTCRHCGADHGKPRLMHGQKPSEFQFSTSHADGIGVVAVAQTREVGVDIESTTRANDMHEIASRFFTNAEQSAMRQARFGPEQTAVFLSAWSAKEAYTKLLGLGLAAPLEALDSTSWQDDAVPDPLTPNATFRIYRPSLPLPTDRCFSLALAVDGSVPMRTEVMQWPPITASPSIE